MPNDQVNNQVEAQVNDGWSYIQQWSWPWGPTVVGTWRQISSWIRSYYS